MLNICLCGCACLREEQHQDDNRKQGTTMAQRRGGMREESECDGQNMRTKRWTITCCNMESVRW